MEQVFLLGPLLAVFVLLAFSHLVAMMDRWIHRGWCSGGKYVKGCFPTMVMYEVDGTVVEERRWRGGEVVDQVIRTLETLYSHACVKIKISAFLQSYSCVKNFTYSSLCFIYGRRSILFAYGLRCTCTFWG